MIPWQDAVERFKRAMGHPARDPFTEGPQSLTHERGELHIDLLAEEFDELVDAIRSHDVVAIAQESIDLIYVALGVLVECGVYAPAVFSEVHAANMRKVGGPTRADGKQLKPPGYVGADVSSVIDRQRRDMVKP